MTDVAVRGPQAPATRPVPVSRAMKSGEFLAHCRDVLEAPFRLIDDANAIKGPLHSHELWQTGDPAVHRRASEWLARQRPRSEIETLHSTLSLALDAPPDERIARLSLGSLLGAYPNAGKDTREDYFATLLHDVMDNGVGPYLLAEACKITRRNVKFLPTVSEFLSAVSTARYPTRCAVERLASVLTCMDRCEEIVATHAAAPADWSEDLWFEAVMAWGACDYAVIWADHLGPPPGEPGCIVPASVIDRYKQARKGWSAREMAA